MNQTKSSFAKILDIIRNLLIIITTIYLLTFIWRWNWIIAIICAIPVYVIIMNIIGFVTLPLYYLTPEHKESKQVLDVESKINLSEEINNNSIQERYAKIPKAEKAKMMFLINKRREQEKEFSPKEFSEENFAKAISCTHNLTENNKKYGHSYCKSYKTLEFTKSSIELAFNYLLDCIKFDENCAIYNNSKFADELRGLHMAMLLTYVNVEFNEIPEDKLKQVKFNSERKINIGENQIEITKLIKWRNKEQWEYFLNSFGYESDLGKICLEKINNNLN